MKISIITLFPKLYDAFVDHSIIKRAINKELVEIEIIDLRLFGIGKNKQVDDFQFGGGAGMVLMAPVLIEAINYVKRDNSQVFLLSPQGPTFNQEKAESIRKLEHFVLICGHYEGFDERIRDYIDEEISIGDYVLTGGEIPAMVIADSVIRLLPGAISSLSLEHESFQNNLLDYPVYTKPVTFNNTAVPDVLLSGHHANIKEWRQQQAELKTKTNRPDLWDKHKKGT